VDGRVGGGNAERDWEKDPGLRGAKGPAGQLSVGGSHSHYTGSGDRPTTAPGLRLSPVSPKALARGGRSDAAGPARSPMRSYYGLSGDQPALLTLVVRCRLNLSNPRSKRLELSA
jgi:hypothetical protein